MGKGRTERAAPDSGQRVTLNGATLEITAASGGAASVGTAPLTIIDNDGPDPIGGTFANLPEGATFTAQGVQWRISYAGGTGNDVTLRAVSASYYTKVTAPAPLVVERSQYWPYTPDQWFESHNSAGVTELGLEWGLAEGRVGGEAGYQTYILLANPGDVQASVQIQFLRESSAPIVKSFVVAPTSRLNVQVGPGADVPELANESFGAIITSTQPIAVERAMYADVNGQTWAAGTNATATRLP